jgi:hypothetical protein
MLYTGRRRVNGGTDDANSVSQTGAVGYTAVSFQ